MFNGVIDVSHHNRLIDWGTVRRAGIAAVVHKASEGAAFRDPAFQLRRAQARDAGLLWGSYHYSSGAPAADQVENYLASADPADDELICLDYEESTAGANMSLDGLVAFVELIRRRTGRRPVVYGGGLLRVACADAGSSTLSSCPLWFACFASEPAELPASWKSWTLWQYTDGERGPPPRRVDGVTGPVDRDLFNGTEAELRSGWPF